jgi:hypothetical protein
MRLGYPAQGLSKALPCRVMISDRDTAGKLWLWQLALYYYLQSAGIQDDPANEAAELALGQPTPCDTSANKTTRSCRQFGSLTLTFG